MKRAVLCIFKLFVFLSVFIFFVLLSLLITLVKIIRFKSKTDHKNGKTTFLNQKVQICNFWILKTIKFWDLEIWKYL